MITLGFHKKNSHKKNCQKKKRKNRLYVVERGTEEQELWVSCCRPRASLQKYHAMIQFDRLKSRAVYHEDTPLIIYTFKVPEEFYI